MAAAGAEPAGRLLVLEGSKRLVVLRPDGLVFASSPVPRVKGQAGGIDSFFALAPHRGAVAFTVTSGRLRGSEAYGSDTVYLLRRGALSAVAVGREPVNFNPCAHWARLQWHGSWLLYGDSEGTLAVIDTTGAHRGFEMRGLVKRLPGTRWGYSAYWSGQPTLGYW